MHRRWKLQRMRKYRNWFSDPKWMERRKDIWKCKIMVELNSFVAFSTTQKTAIVEHIFGEWIEGPKVALSWIARLTRYFDKTIIETVMMVGKLKFRIFEIFDLIKIHLKLCRMEFCHAGNFSL